jgi:hypothetical protein
MENFVKVQAWVTFGKIFNPIKVETEQMASLEKVIDFYMGLNPW